MSADEADYLSDEVVLEHRGWCIECEGPFEISLKEDPESRATGYAAELVTQALREDIVDNAPWVIVGINSEGPSYYKHKTIDDGKMITSGWVKDPKDAKFFTKEDAQVFLEGAQSGRMSFGKIQLKGIFPPPFS